MAPLLSPIEMATQIHFFIFIWIERATIEVLILMASIREVCREILTESDRFPRTVRE
jgi:hypothetical protein